MIELIPQSITTAPGLIQLPFTISGRPMATTRISACLAFYDNNENILKRILGTDNTKVQHLEILLMVFNRMVHISSSKHTCITYTGQYNY